MTEEIIKRAYDAGVTQANNKECLSQEKIKVSYAKFFIDLCNEIRPIVKQKLIGEKKLFDNIAAIRKLHHDEIIHDVINEVLLNNGISPFSIAFDIELAVQTSFIKGYLEHNQLSEKEFFDLNVRGGPQLISDWIYSLLQVKGNETSSGAITQDELLREYFYFDTPYPFRAIFIRIGEDLAEDAFRTGHRKNGSTYVYYIADPVYGNKEVLGGSYAYVKHFANSKTHEAHHLIPAKLLKMTGILGYMDGPCIRMEIKDHKQTRSHNNRGMLDEDYFKKQLDCLKSNNISLAVEIEIADIQEKFGSKYDDAIKEVREYVSILEKKLK